MAVLLPGRFLYLALPHTASMVTAHALQGLKSAVPKEKLEVAHHGTRADVERRHSDLLLGSEIAVSVVRHPCDLLVTWWIRHCARMHRVKRPLKPPAFLEFIQAPEEEIRKFSTAYLRGGRMFWMDADVFLRYENLQLELNQFLARFAIPPVTLKRSNVTEGKQPWRTYFDGATLSAARERFGEEAAQFGYEVK